MRCCRSSTAWSRRTGPRTPTSRRSSRRWPPSWSVSDDGKTYTFKLRQGVKFHDGTPFNAEAADFNFKRMTDPNQSVLRPAGRQHGARRAAASSRALRWSTTTPSRSTSSEPNTGFIEALASLPNYYMESPAAFEKYGKDSGQHAVGTGPFKLVEWVRGQRTVMARNDDYWGKKPYVDQMIYRPITEPAARAAALKAGEVQIAWDLPVDQVDAFKADPRFNVFLRGIPATKVIECWQKSGPFSDMQRAQGGQHGDRPRNARQRHPQGHSGSRDAALRHRLGFLRQVAAGIRQVRSGSRQGAARQDQVRRRVHLPHRHLA